MVIVKCNKSIEMDLSYCSYLSHTVLRFKFLHCSRGCCCLRLISHLEACRMDCICRLQVFSEKFLSYRLAGLFLIIKIPW